MHKRYWKTGKAVTWEKEGLKKIIDIFLVRVKVRLCKTIHLFQSAK
jgi:hypothetical protein